MSPNTSSETSPLGGSGGPGGPLFIPIFLMSNATTFVTGPTPVDFTLTLPGQQELPILINYYEVQSQPGPSTAPNSQSDTDTESEDHPKPMPVYDDLAMQVVRIPNAPTPVWNNGVATFTLQLDASVLGRLTYKQTLFMAVAHIDDPDYTDSSGICSIPINLPPSPPS